MVIQKKKKSISEKVTSAMQTLFPEKTPQDALYRQHLQKMKKIKNVLVPEPEPVTGISFCISTNGAKFEKTSLEISSIRRTMSRVDVPYEIIVAGDVEVFKDIGDLLLVRTPEDAHKGLLAKLRNNAAEHARYGVLVFIDDDIIFTDQWAHRLVEFSRQHGWSILNNRILLPNGGRYWDKATIYPHRMVDYNDSSPRGIIYQCGCFWIIRKSVYDVHKWDSSIGFYAEKSGNINEDVEYTLRLREQGYTFTFDKKNLIWHYDDGYVEWDYNSHNKVCLRIDEVKEKIPVGTELTLHTSAEFISLLDDLTK